MQSDDDLQTTLSKWPFILGDVILVATALAIAVLGHWQLSNWQVASCVISVALGAGLFVLPYIVEFRVRVREEAEDHKADLRILQRHMFSAQEQLEAVADRIESLEAALNHVVQAKPDLTATIEVLEGKIVPLHAQQAEQANDLNVLVRQVDALAVSINSKPEVEVLESFHTELAALQDKVEGLATKAIEAARSEASSEEAKPKAVVPVESIAKKNREPRKRRKPEPRLLNRAIEQKQDNSSVAVSRIIESRSRKMPVDDEAAVQLSPAGSFKPEPETEPVEEVELPESKSEILNQPEELNEVIKNDPSKEPKSDEAVLGVKAKQEEVSAEEALNTPESELESAVLDAPANESSDMFGAAVPAEVKKSTRTKKSDTAIIASVFIGIGNKPYVRGSGEGLNWNSGIAMEFEEIGKWRWIAPAGLEKPVEILLYRNDEDSDRTGKYILEPGQQLEVSPVFS